MKRFSKAGYKATKLGFEVLLNDSVDSYLWDSSRVVSSTLTVSGTTASKVMNSMLSSER